MLCSHSFKCFMSSCSVKHRSYLFDWMTHCKYLMLHIYEVLLNYFITLLDILIRCYLIDVKTQQSIKSFNHFKRWLVTRIHRTLTSTLFDIAESNRDPVLGLLLLSHLWDSLTFWYHCYSKNMEYCLAGRDATRSDPFSGLGPHAADCTLELIY